MFHGISVFRTTAYPTRAHSLMEVDCKSERIEFHVFGKRDVVGKFDGLRIASGGGGVLL